MWRVGAVYAKPMNQMKANPFLVAVIAALSVGLGVTGTLLYVETQKSAAPAPVSAPFAQNAPPPAMPSPSAALPTDGDWVAQGNFFYDKQQWPQAVEAYQKALAAGIDNPDVRTDLGNAFRFSDQPQKALEQYQIAQKQNPNHENSLFNQGGLYALSMNDSKKGVAAWKAYLKRFPNGRSADAARNFIAQHGG